MENFTSVFVIPVVVAVVAGSIVVVIEYFFVQPVRRAIDSTVKHTVNDRDWATAIKSAISRFRKDHYGVIGQWIPRPNETITIREWNIVKGRGTLVLTLNRVVETLQPGVIGFVRAPLPISHYRLVIDRSGDILEIKAEPVQINPRNYGMPAAPPRIKNRKRPRVESTSGGVNVIIEFDIENLGAATKICPYIEFKLVTSRGSGEYKPKTFNTKPKSYDLPANCLQPFRFTLFFPHPEIPLVESPHEVKIELRSYQS
jgi:hypothetical protein